MKLTKAARRTLPKSSFAGPGRSFPIQDKTHQREAISGATRSYRAGNISRSTMERVQSAARARLRGS